MRRAYRRAGGHLDEGGGDRQARAGGAHGSCERGYSTSDHDAWLVRPETWRYRCPICGRNALDIKHAPHRDGGWTVLVYCHHCHAATRDIAEAADVPMHRLLRWPPPDELGPPEDGGRAAGSGPEVSEGTIGGCASALWTQQYEHVLTYLRSERGLTDETIRRYELGYDRDEDAILIPVRDATGNPVALKRRFLAPDAKPKTANSVGPLRLYPALPAKGWLLFVPGELDALSGRQLRLPTVTSTGGWLSKDQFPLLSRRQIVLLPDVGEELAAEYQADALRKEGCEVLIVHWPRGCPDKFDLNDWVAKRGGTRDALLGLIWQAAKGARP